MLVLCPATYAGMETLTVVAPTPVDAGRAPTDAQPAIQIATREIIEQQRSASIADLLNSVAANVTVNEAQGNPLQADLQYRGFVASPLLGLPQGLAVYMDGVRINEPFGDTVNWSLIPQAALRSILATLKPGGKALILEFSRPADALRPAYDLYSFKVLPTLGKLVADDAASYQYLAESIRMHPDQETLLGMMKDAGFEKCRFHNLTGGVVALHVGYKI